MAACVREERRSEPRKRGGKGEEEKKNEPSAESDGKRRGEKVSTRSLSRGIERKSRRTLCRLEARTSLTGMQHLAVRPQPSRSATSNPTSSTSTRPVGTDGPPVGARRAAVSAGGRGELTTPTGGVNRGAVLALSGDDGGGGRTRGGHASGGRGGGGGVGSGEGLVGRVGVVMEGTRLRGRGGSGRSGGGHCWWFVKVESGTALQLLRGERRREGKGNGRRR
jgi:hypothetical protein